MNYVDTIADYLEENNYTVQVGKLYNTSADNSINLNKVVVYPKEAAYRQCIDKLKGYNNQQAKILVHWNKSYTDSIAVAERIYSLFDSNVYNNLIFTPRQSSPVELGTDSYDIWEFVIELNIIEQI
jgi:hypothetical protein